MAGKGSDGWVTFFREAGIPPAIAADYAITFHDNRIQRNMLLDLNREILKEMGITLIGDVIAILRHAKNVHDKTARDRILSVQSSPRKGGSKSQKDSSEGTPRNKKHSSKESSKSLNLTAAADDDCVEVLSAKKHTVPTKRLPIQEEVEDLSMEVDGVTATSTPGPAKKARMVLPEHEGGYRITMPSGSTPRSRAILSMIAARNKQRGTVFDRLGECIVSSTTEGGSPADESMGASTTVITVTGVGSSSTKVEKSVFSRLGGRPPMIPTTGKTLSPLQNARGSGLGPGQLQYAGILKKNSNSPTRKSVVTLKQKKTGTMRADQQTENAKDRLGLKHQDEKANRPVEPAVVTKILSTTGKSSAGILTNPENAVSRSVKTRLGVTVSGRESMRRSTVKQRITGPSSNIPTIVTVPQTPGMRSNFVRNFKPRGGFQPRGGRFSAGATARRGFRH